MACDISKVIAIANSQIGYLEKETWNQQDDFTANAGSGNYTKYSRDLAKLNYFNSSKRGVAWCAVFVAWCFVQAYGEQTAKALLCQPDNDNCGAGCESARNYFKRRGQLFETPEVGDMIFFWNSAKQEASHTGIVYKVDTQHVYTIEGNTSSASGVVANGGAVAAKRYQLDHHKIAGYGRPAFGEEGNDQICGSVNSNELEVEQVTTGKAWVQVENGTTVNFRQRPSTAAPKVKGMNTIKQGEEVMIVAGDQTWAAVEYKGYEGFVMLKYLTQEEPEQAASGSNVDAIVSQITSLLQELVSLAKN